MREAGWPHARAEAWRPGAGRARTQDDRVRVSVFVIPTNADAPEDPVSPGVPTSSARARTRARASTAWGHLGTRRESSITTGNGGPGDTNDPGDTEGPADTPVEPRSEQVTAADR